MNSNQFLDCTAIARAIKATWAGMDFGMLELVSGKLAASQVTPEKLRYIIEAVAGSCEYKPTLKHFLQHIPKEPKKRSATVSDFFGLQVTNRQVMTELGELYQRADWLGIINVLLSQDWAEQDGLVQILISKLSIQEREKQERRQKLGSPNAMAMHFRRAINKNNTLETVNR